MAYDTNRKKSFELRPGQGSMFTNRKMSHEKSPTHTGKALVQVGDQLIDLDIAAWARKSEKAGTWFSLSVKVKNVRDNPDVEGAFATNFDRQGPPRGDDDDVEF